MIDLKKITFGFEHEFANWPAIELKEPAFGLYRDTKDITIVSGNGIANDPSLKFYHYGGEICTPPTDSISGQAEILAGILKRWPECGVNYRSNLHTHIRVPGLAEDLTYLKRLARFNAHWLPIILPIVEPIPGLDWPDSLEKAMVCRGSRRRHKRRKVSHHTVLPADRLLKQAFARTVQEFHEAEVPRSKAGAPMWHAQPRAAVNVRQLLQTETIEFRHSPGTLDCNRLDMVGQWCLCYLRCALGDWGVPEEASPLASYGGDLALYPKFEPYQHDLEIKYRATCHDGSLPKNVIAENIAAILAGNFDSEAWEAKLKW